MRLLWTFALAACASLGLVTVAWAASAKDQVVAAYAAWDQAFNTGDALKLAPFYTDDTVFLPPTHDVMKGQAGVEKFFTGVFADGVTDHKLEVIEVKGDDDDAVVVAAAKWSAKGKDGSALGGVATHVFERQSDGSLKLELQTFN